MIEAAQLEPAIAAVYTAYVAELGEAFALLEPWWARLEAGCDRRTLRLRWPAGVASHPRILAIYRDYHQRFSTAARPSAAGPTLRFDDDAAWGSEAESAPSSLIPIAPERLLVERLQIEAPTLYAKMIHLVMSPVGEAPEPKPSLRNLEVIEPDPRRAQAFQFRGRHGVARGVERLLGAAADLYAEPRIPVAPAEASEFHRLAHNTYLRDLERALVAAERWWTAELGDREARGMSAEEALASASADHPIGPVAHPRVLGVLAAHWALCEEVNAVLPTAEGRVGPEQVLLGWLRDGPRASWVEALAALPYWPIGLDEHGRWV
jgi:hypothetical protein